MSSKIKYKSKFLDGWRGRVEFKDWLKKVPNDPSVALCVIAIKTMQLVVRG